MRYVLVDKRDNIVYTVDLASNIGVSGARTYFLGFKKIDKKVFDALWKVMKEDDYNKKLETYTRKSSSQIEWWDDESDYLDIEKS